MRHRIARVKARKRELMDRLFHNRLPIFVPFVPLVSLTRTQAKPFHHWEGYTLGGARLVAEYRRGLLTATVGETDLMRFQIGGRFDSAMTEAELMRWCGCRLVTPPRALL